MIRGKGALSLNSIADVWKNVLDRLRSQLSETTINTWFDEVEVVTMEDSAFVLHCSNSFKKSTIEARFMSHIKAALKDIFSSDLEVKILDDQQLSAYHGVAPDRPGSLLESDAFTFGTYVVGPQNKMAYAAARAAAADALHPGTGSLLRTPNNILGIEYCKAILHRHAALTPLALPRLGAAHGGGAGAHAGTPMASASFLRGLPQPDWEPFVPARAAELYGRAAADGLLLDGARLETAVLALLRMQDPADFAQVRGVSEGLENRLTAAVREADSLDDLYTRLKTKRYPHARLRRRVLGGAFAFPAELPMPPYLHVLGARKAALPRLKQASLPAATALADLARTGPEAAKISRLHNKAVDFSSLCREKIQPMGLAFTAKPVVI